MKHLNKTLGLITLIANLSAQEPPNTKPAETSRLLTGDAKAMQGTWIPVKAELSGQPLPPPILKAITLKVEGGKYEVVVKGEPEADRGTYTLTPSSEPKRMTITSTYGPNRGRTFPTIYELKGDTLQVCYDLSGTSHPTEFKSVAGTQLYLVTYKKNKE